MTRKKLGSDLKKNSINSKMILIVDRYSCENVSN